MLNKNKRAQITVFVILGIVILIAVGLYFFISSETKAPSIPTPTELETVPAEFKPVRGFVESCMFQIAEEGIKKLAAHGGYIDPLDEDYTLFAFNYNPLKPTESDVVSLSSSIDSSIIPYWYYLQGKDKGAFAGVNTWAPSISFMQLQLSSYVENHLSECLAGFTELEETGFDVEILSSPSVDTTIFDGGQDFLLTYNLKTTKDSASQDISEFYVRSQLPLKKLYDIAYNITQYESATNHLALFTKKLIRSRTGPKMDMLPPFFYSDTNKFSMFWMKPVVKQKIQNLLTSYSQVLQVLGTKNFDDSFIEKIPENESLEKMFYLKSILPVFPQDNIETSDVSVNFLYLNQPIYLDVSPSQGNKIRITPKKDDLGIFAKILPEDTINNYRFFYDVSYPMIVELRNTDSENKNNEMQFIFALEVNLRKNYVVNDLILGNGPIPWSDDVVQITMVDTATSAPPVGSQSLIYGSSASQNIFCDASQFQSGNISIMVYNKLTNEALDGAGISYSCGTYAECYIGQTILQHNSGYLSQKFPICMNGYVLIEKRGYHSKRIKLTTEYNRPNSLGTVGLYPIITKNISIKNFPILFNYSTGSSNMRIIGTGMYDQSFNFTENESAIIMMKLVQDSFQPDFEVFLSITGNESITADLVPGRYSIDITYLNNEGVTVPEKCDRECIDNCEWYDLGDKKYIYFPEDPIEIKPAPWGGLDFNESNAISFRPNDLYNVNSTLEFYTFTYPEPNEIACLDSLEEMGKKTEYTLQYRTKLIPQFIDNAN